MYENVEAFIDIAALDFEVIKESNRALEIYNKSDYITKTETGKHTLVRTKALERGLENAVDTIAKVSVERDHYKEIVGTEANQQNHLDMIANKIAKKNRDDKNRTALTELKQMLEQRKAVCNKGEKNLADESHENTVRVSPIKRSH